MLNFGKFANNRRVCKQPQKRMQIQHNIRTSTKFEKLWSTAPKWGGDLSERINSAVGQNELAYIKT